MAGYRATADKSLTHLIAASKPLQIGIQRLTLIELNTKAVQQHRDLGVLADREDDIHALLLVEVLRQFRPDRFGDEVLAMQVVGGTQQCRVRRAPARRPLRPPSPGRSPA